MEKPSSTVTTYIRSFCSQAEFLALLQQQTFDGLGQTFDGHLGLQAQI